MVTFSAGFCTGEAVVALNHHKHGRHSVKKKEKAAVCPRIPSPSLLVQQPRERLLELRIIVSPSTPVGRRAHLSHAHQKRPTQSRDSRGSRRPRTPQISRQRPSTGHRVGCRGC